MTWEVWITLGIVVILLIYIVARQWYVNNISSGDWDQEK